MRLLALTLFFIYLLPAASVVDQRIAVARQQTAGKNAGFQTYNDLAAALCRKARDTSDASLYKQAAEAIDKSLAISPGNYDALKLRSVVLTGEHKYQEARKLSQELNKKVPDDIATWAQLTEINIALHNYDEAERDAQWILDLRRASALGFEEAAKLREISGDKEGAIEFFGEALTRTAQSDLDQRAWLLTQKARLTLLSGNADSAAAILNQALALFPDSKAAASILAEIRGQTK